MGGAPIVAQERLGSATPLVESTKSYRASVLILLVLFYNRILICLQVSAVPTVIAMRGGDVVGQFVGIKDDDELDSFVSKIIGQ